MSPRGSPMPAVDDTARWTAGAGAWLVPTHALDAAAFLITKVNGAAGLTATHRAPRLPVSGVRNAPVETPHWPNSATWPGQAVTGSLVVPTVSSTHHTAAARPRQSDGRCVAASWRRAGSSEGTGGNAGRGRQLGLAVRRPTGYYIQNQCWRAPMTVARGLPERKEVLTTYTCALMATRPCIRALVRARHAFLTVPSPLLPCWRDEWTCSHDR